MISNNSLHARLNATLLVFQLLDITISKIAYSIPVIGYYNEFIFLCICLLLGFVTFQRGKINKDIILIFVLLSYSVFQILFWNLPKSHLIQGIIYVEFIVYFIYFNNLKYEVKVKTVYYLGKYFKIFIIPVMLIAIVDIVNPSITRNLLSLGAEHDRGISGFYLQSLFGSTTGLSQFCLLMLFIYYIYNNIFTRRKLLNAFQYFLILCLAFFSFSRKEVSLLFLFVFFMFHVGKYQKIYLRKLIFPMLIGCIILVGYIILFFGYANDIAFSEEYNRFKMVDYSVQIIKEKFPFGSGVGTFGSQMSLNYGKIYDEFNVGPEMTGYNGERGPIYDAFLFTFLAEQGVGLLMYIYVVLTILWKSTFKNIEIFRYIRYYMAFTLLIIGFFAPVIMNAYGLISFSIFGLITQGARELKS